MNLSVSDDVDMVLGGDVVVVEEVQEVIGDLRGGWKFNVVHEVVKPPLSRVGCNL